MPEPANVPAFSGDGGRPPEAVNRPRSRGGAGVAGAVATQDKRHAGVEVRPSSALTPWLARIALHNPQLSRNGLIDDSRLPAAPQVVRRAGGRMPSIDRPLALSAAGLPGAGSDGRSIVWRGR